LLILKQIKSFGERLWDNDSDLSDLVGTPSLRSMYSI